MIHRLLLYQCFGWDIGELIREHAASMIIQRCWVRYTLFRHTHSPAWAEIRAQLVALGVYHELLRFSDVRREWRFQLGSWQNVSDVASKVLVSECHGGLWGPHTNRIGPLTQDSRRPWTRAPGAPP